MTGRSGKERGTAIEDLRSARRVEILALCRYKHAGILFEINVGRERHPLICQACSVYGVCCRRVGQGSLLLLADSELPSVESGKVIVPGVESKAFSLLL